MVLDLTVVSLSLIGQLDVGLPVGVVLASRALRVVLSRTRAADMGPGKTPRGHSHGARESREDGADASSRGSKP